MARKKVAKSNEDDVLKSMFPDLPTRDDEEQEQKADTTRGGGGEDYSKVIDELRAKLAEQDRALEESRRERLALMSQPQRVVAPQPPKIDNSTIPNPIDDPEGYATAIRKQIEAETNYKREVEQFQQQQQQTQQSRLSSLWDSFQEAHPDYAENQKRVEIAATQVVQKAQQRGLNLDQYMYGNSSLFMKDVIKEMDDLFGKPTADTDDDEDAGDEDDTPDMRTSGILGGGGRSTRSGGRSQQEKLGSISDELRAWQEKTGFGR